MCVCVCEVTFMLLCRAVKQDQVDGLSSRGRCGVSVCVQSSSEGHTHISDGSIGEVLVLKSSSEEGAMMVGAHICSSSS